MNPWQAIFFGLKQIPRELTAFEIEAPDSTGLHSRSYLVRFYSTHLGVASCFPDCMSLDPQ